MKYDINYIYNFINDTLMRLLWHYQLIPNESKNKE